MRCLYVADNGTLGLVDDVRLEATTERHRIALTVSNYEPHGHEPPEQRGQRARRRFQPLDPVRALDEDRQLEGAILESSLGWVRRGRLVVVRAVLARHRRVWVYWPAEQAIECVDRERLASLWRHWAFITTYHYGSKLRARVRQLPERFRRYVRAVDILRNARRHIGTIQLVRWTASRLTRSFARTGSSAGEDLRRLCSDSRLKQLDAHLERATPVSFHVPYEPNGTHRITGCGAYLRTDFWARIQSGGSYGHTCYVAKELAAITERFVCFMANQYPLLDSCGLRQVVFHPPSATATEDDIVSATRHYYPLLRRAFDELRPAYLYERLCLGNYAGALVSRALGIPYIVEYNGSEISMRRSFDGVGYVYEHEYIKAEALAFKQATMISVVSAQVKASLVARGIDANKILVNPNGADTSVYSPLQPRDKRQLRAELGFGADPVVGFTGTFGGWHGVDVLAEAIPKICARAPGVKFLLIGDGNYKHLVDAQVERYGLLDRIRSVGRVPQEEGARLLQACDIYVSPHNSHMVDSPFFGSPTKIFEYMAMGGAIVASDLEQIGEVLSPALSVADLIDGPLAVDGQRAVLCTPGDVEEFVQAVVELAERPRLWPLLGRNARNAVEQDYSWAKHVARLWPFLAGERAPERTAAPVRRNRSREASSRRMAAAPAGVPTAEDMVVTAVASQAQVRSPRVLTGDAYKDEIQRQWDNDPAGSHYVKQAEAHTLSWFSEAEAYRYGEYAPWMARTMEFDRFSGKQVLEIGGGMGTDLAQFARHGAVVTDLDLSAGHLELAQENFRLRGLTGRFLHHDAESLLFENDTFDLVYTNGVLHHTPNTVRAIAEIRRVLKPGGRVIAMMYAENSLHYWRNLVWAIGLKERQLQQYSMGEIMSRSVERSEHKARPLVKVYTKKRLHHLFDDFTNVKIVQRQMVAAEVPRGLTWVPLPVMGKLAGWNLIVKAHKP
jgi:glycosyltransferase involved in cell wall biosynthesis/ubiquinone/menaquinone biosynthesis C-methylase UbiE